MPFIGTYRLTDTMNSTYQKFSIGRYKVHIGNALLKDKVKYGMLNPDIRSEEICSLNLYELIHMWAKTGISKVN